MVNGGRTVAMIHGGSGIIVRRWRVLERRVSLRVRLIMGGDLLTVRRRFLLEVVQWQ